MITFKKEIEVPRLKIMYDECAESPRVFNNIGYFITKESRYNSPDKGKAEGIVMETSEDANNQEHHIELIKEVFEETVLHIFPVTKYEHSGISYSLGNSTGFDCSNNGFYIVTEKSLSVLFGEIPSENRIIKIIEAEIETYNKWANGEIYCFELLDDNGGFEDSCGGFFEIEDIMEHLPKEFEDENLGDYLRY